MKIDRFKKRSFKELVTKMFIIKKGDSKKVVVGKIIDIVALLLLVSALVVGGVLLTQNLITMFDDKQIEQAYPSDTTSEVTPSSEDEAEPLAPTVDKSDFNSDGIFKKLESLYKINNDLVGMITIDGTGLKRPVMQSKLGINEGGNEYYLKKSMQLNYKPQGEVFADCRSTFQGKNRSDIVTLYGHSTSSKMYFENIFDYNKEDFYKKHPTVKLDTIYEGTEIYKVVYFCYVPVYTGESITDEQFNYHDYYNVDQTQFNKYMSEMEKRSYFTTGVDVKYGDKLLVLSTCDREVDVMGHAPYRKVLVTRRVRDGESTAVNVNLYKPNTDMVTPLAWQKMTGKKNIYE